MADSRLDKLKNLLQGAFLSHVPDHPSHGGNTGDTEWSPDGQAGEEEAENDEGDPSADDTDADQFDAK
jgi:hypothetical protein